MEQSDTSSTPKGAVCLESLAPATAQSFDLLLLCGNFHRPVHLYSCLRTLFATLLRLHSYGFGRNTFLANHFSEAFGGSTICESCILARRFRATCLLTLFHEAFFELSRTCDFLSRRRHRLTCRTFRAAMTFQGLLWTLNSLVKRCVNATERDDLHGSGSACGKRIRFSKGAAWTVSIYSMFHTQSWD